MTKRKKRVLAVVISMAVVSIAMFLAISYFTGKQIVASSTQLVTNETTKTIHEAVWAGHGFNVNTFAQEYTIETIQLPSSFDGHTIPADFIYSKDKNRDVVIMAHGLGGNRFTNYPMAAFFLENGYNVMTYDQRSSGENTAKNTTFGYWEKYDLIDCIRYVQQFVSGKKIGVWGESFGGATAVQAVAYEGMQEDIAFLILDCPVSSMEWMVGEEMKNMDLGIPLAYLIWCGNLVNQMELGFSYQEADCAEIAKRIHIPTLVINSEADKLTPYFMGKDIYDSLASTEKKIWTVTDSEHVGMWSDYNEQYRSEVLNLIKGE